MDDKTEILISLGASTAANCAPCFEYYFRKAAVLGLNINEIEKAVEIGNKVKTGASIAMAKSIKSIRGSETKSDGGDSATTVSRPCC